MTQTPDTDPMDLKNSSIDKEVRSFAKLVAAAEDADTISKGSCDDLARFYNEHNGPLPYARKRHPGVESAFTQVFMSNWRVRGLHLHETSDCNCIVTTSPKL